MPLYIFNLNPHTQSVKSKYNTEKQKHMDRGHIRLCGSAEVLPDRGHHFPTGAMMGSADQPEIAQHDHDEDNCDRAQTGAVTPRIARMIPAFGQPSSFIHHVALS